MSWADTYNRTDPNPLTRAYRLRIEGRNYEAALETMGDRSSYPTYPTPSPCERVIDLLRKPSSDG